MTRKILGVLGIMIIVLSIIYIARPAGHIPPYDANLVRLAETELQGYCSGKVFWNTSGNGDADSANRCRIDLANIYSNEINLVKTESAFCQAVVDQGWQGTKEDCFIILEESQYWPTYDGSISNQWNRARPYPKPVLQSNGSQTDSRTGVRPGVTREIPSRTTTETETTPTETETTEEGTQE